MHNYVLLQKQGRQNRISLSSCYHCMMAYQSSLSHTALICFVNGEEAFRKVTILCSFHLCVITFSSVIQHIMIDLGTGNNNKVGSQLPHASFFMGFIVPAQA